MLRRVAVDFQPSRLDGGVGRRGQGPVGVQAFGSDVQAAARQQLDGFIVDRWRAQGRIEHRIGCRCRRMHIEQGGVLVPQDEFDFAVLVGLETGRGAQIGADGRVFGRRHGGQHVPGMHQLVHDARHAGQHFEGGRQVAALQVGAHGVHFVQHQLHPQFAGLVLHNEEHLVVVGRERVLGREDAVQRQVIPVAHRFTEIHLRAMPFGALAGARMHGAAAAVFFFAHGVLLVRGQVTASRLAAMS